MINLTPAPFTVGDIEVHQVVEMQFPFLTPASFLPDAPADMVESLRGRFEPWALCPTTGKLIIAVQTYVLKVRGMIILVDTCVGCDKTSGFDFWNMRSDTTWLHRLAAIGIVPESVDYVFCTHLHGDHVGWNTQLKNGRYVPTFPNAKYIFSKIEAEHARVGEDHRKSMWEQSVLPVLEAGQAQLVATDFALNDQVWLEPTPGHTPGHVAVRLESQGKSAVLTGDVIHSPLQCVHPEWSSRPDIDRTLAAKTRHKLLNSAMSQNSLLLTSHFPLPSVGKLKAASTGFGFEYFNAATK